MRVFMVERNLLPVQKGKQRTIRKTSALCSGDLARGAGGGGGGGGGGAGAKTAVGRQNTYQRNSGQTPQIIILISITVN